MKHERSKRKMKIKLLTSLGSRFVSNSLAQADWRLQSSYKWFICVQTRWNDNDQYGHINNANYHAIYDSIINIYLQRHCGLDTSLGKSSRVGFMVTNACKFYAPAKYPNIYLSGLSTSHVGNTSIKYQVALFAPKDPKEPIVSDLVRGHFTGDRVLEWFEKSAVCTGEYVHVLVDPKNDNKPAAIPDDWKGSLELIKYKC